MDSHLAAVLKRSTANLLDKTHFSEGEDELMPTKPLTLTETQVQPIDLSLKSPCPFFYPLDHKQILPCDNETNSSHLGKNRGQGCVLREVEDKTDGKIALKEHSLCDSLSSDEGSTPVSSVDLNHSCDSLVDVKEEVEEVCIGELHGYCEDYSCTPLFLNEIKPLDKDSTENTVCGSNVNIDKVSKDMAEQLASVVETQKPDLNLNAKYPSKTATGLSGKVPLNSKGCIVTNELSEKGLSAQSSDGTDEGCPNLGQQESDFSVVPSGSGKGPYGLRQEMGDETNINRVDTLKGVKRKVEEGEILNLSLSKIGGKRGVYRIDQLLEEETLNEMTPVMQMEVKEEEHELNFFLRKEESVIVSHWEPNLSHTLPVTLSHSPASDTDDFDTAGLLLIDDQGIPYFLTPDGEKVAQVTPPKSCKGSAAILPKSKTKQVEVKDCPAALFCDSELPKKDSTQAVPSTPQEMSPHHNSAELLESRETVMPLDTKSAQGTPITSPPSNSSFESPSLSDLATHTIQDLGNPKCNVLALSSQLPNPPLTEPNSGTSLLALSLPVSLKQNPPPTPLLLVLSPVAPSPNTPSSSTSSFSVTDTTASSLVPSRTQSPSPAPVSLSSVSTVSSSPSSSSPPTNDPDCSAPTAPISGNSNCSQPVPNSPTTSLSGNGKPVEPDLTSKKIVPKCSPLHGVLKQDDSSESTLPSFVETQTESTSPVTASVCPDKTLRSASPLSSLDPSLHACSRGSPSLDTQPVLTSDTPGETFGLDESHYPVCSTPPSTVIFPSNHPKNFTLSSTCPRRILYCQFCPRAFYYLSDLERHSITHSQSKPHVCPLCSKAFKRSSHLERHKHIHTGQRNFICPICSKRFREAGELLRHQRVHTGEKPFQCPLCHMRFAERNTLRRHTKRKHQEPIGQVDADGMQGNQGESAEWYSCTVPDSDSDTELDKE
ncbi:mucin-6 [Scleropages formosus]|uniref:Mucin-6-like n=1 Tax=Scleropages formosus TaxID=113540 RepID=A0A8C9UXQ2_SCLFO|nr:mucin-6-like [Scleropages formosus]XP_018591177.1 mucin-6-like [Scleropages formosus]